jgi:predicted XRE-type DNA-binding protein
MTQLSPNSDVAITYGSGDVFLDLGFSPETAANLRIKSELMLNLRKLIRSNNWSINQAAESLSTSETVLENLLSGQIDQFSIDQLVALVSNAGLAVDINIRSESAA